MTAAIRDATPADLPGVLAISNEAVRGSTAVYTEQAATLADREAWLAQRAGTLREVGTKFGRWLDLVFMQRFRPDGR